MLCLQGTVTLCLKSGSCDSGKISRLLFFASPMSCMNKQLNAGNGKELTSKFQSRLLQNILCGCSGKRQFYFMKLKVLSHEIVGRRAVWRETLKTRSILNIEKLEAKKLLGCIYF